MDTQNKHSNASDCSELIMKHQILLSKISHEIRNPVTLINSFLQLVEKHHPELSDDYYWIKVMENMDFLKLLLNDFSEFNNSEILHEELLDITQLFYETIESTKPSLASKNITLHVFADSHIPAFKGDKIKIKQMLLNLLRNAEEAITASGNIICTLHYTNHQILISIKDDGPGISEEDQKNLFAPFVTHKQEGTGLGLAICKKIANAHGGTISCHSTPEKGTEFIIILPKD